jgi:hypothetical protein
MMDTTFRLWLIDEDWRSLLGAILLETDAFDAAMVSFNAQFAQAFGGIRKNWFGILISQAQRYAQGQDILTVASDAAQEMLQLLQTKPAGDQFVQGVEHILAIPDETQKAEELTNFFATAGRLRVRRHAGQFHRRRDQMTTHFSAIDGGSASGGSAVNNVRDRSSPTDSEDRMESLRRGIMMELEKMKQSANDKRTKERFELAKRVAEKRMENPPEFPGLDELEGMFPEVGRTKLFQILQDIQAAATAAASKIGIDTASIQDAKRARKHG